MLNTPIIPFCFDVVVDSTQIKPFTQGFCRSVNGGCCCRELTRGGGNARENGLSPTAGEEGHSQLQLLSADNGTARHRRFVREKLTPKATTLRTMEAFSETKRALYAPVMGFRDRRELYETRLGGMLVMWMD